jgi:acyl-CoA synthetase (NDP forming)
VIAAASAVLAATAAERWNERQSLELFTALGIACAQSVVVTDAALQVDMACPVAIKLLSADVPHKTDAGMVRLDVETELVPATVKAMLADARRRFPRAKIDGVLVQRMERGLAEVIVGYRRDAEVGPTVLLGIGGIMAELKRASAYGSRR